MEEEISEEINSSLIQDHHLPPSGDYEDHQALFDDMDTDVPNVGEDGEEASYGEEDTRLICPQCR